jgi:hypothetical protein
MSETETRLRELFNIAAGEPPRSVSIPAVRRAARRRSRLRVGGSSAAAVLAGLGVAVPVLALGQAAPPSRSAVPVGLPLGTSVPRYYLQQPDPIVITPVPEPVVVRSTATGAVTARLRCPWAGASVAEGQIAAAGISTFFIACTKPHGLGGLVTGTRLYRFELTSAGTVTRYSPVPGGWLPGLAVGGLTAAANGSDLAMAAYGAPRPHVRSRYLVINTRTGARATWRWGADGDGAMAPYDLSLAANGRELTFVVGGARSAEMVEVGPASRGGLLTAAARVLVRPQALEHLPRDVIPYARVSADGRMLTVVGAGSLGADRKPELVTEQISVTTGKVVRIVFRARVGSSYGFYCFARSDPSGRYLILDFGPRPRMANGWLSDSHLVPLKPLDAPAYEIW